MLRVWGSMALTKRKKGAFLECSEILTKPSITNFSKIDLYWWEVGGEGWRRKGQTGCGSETK